MQTMVEEWQAKLATINHDWTQQLNAVVDSV
jgi:hypothetical protein